MSPPRSGTLFVVATPIGNLEDLTPRALRVLREVAVVACEDTRRTRQLLGSHGIRTPLTSYFDHNEDEKAGLSPSAALLKAGVKSDLFCVGTPAQLRDFVQKYADAGVDQLIFNCQLGHLGHEDIMSSLKLFGSEVLPKFRGV